MSIGTFGSFTQARLAIYAAQTGITVTGNNISNINTPGYTRQRLDQVSLYVNGADRYYAEGDIRTGQGALVKSLSQIRSPYLDIRYRTLNAQMGYADGRLEILEEIQRILDEVGAGDESKGEGGHGILGLELEKLGEAFKNLVDQTGHQEYDNTVRQISKNLVTLLNKYANKLEEVQESTITKLNQDIDKINGCLTTIRSLNEEIRKSEIHGDPALELRDERNLQIDQLSELIDIDVTYSEEEITAGLTVEKLTIRLGNANPDGSVRSDEALLVDGVFAAQMKIDQVPVKREFDPNDTTTWPYANANGDPVATKDEAALVKVKNPDWDQVDLNTEFLGPDGKPTDEAHAAEEPRANDDYQPYLTEDGKPTNDILKAKKVVDPNYNMSITKLKNSINEVYVAINRGTVKGVSGTDTVDDGAGNQVAIEDLFKGGRNSFTVETPDLPTVGDKTLMIYKRVLLANGNYAYTQQMVTQEVSKKVSLDDNDLGGKIQAWREMLTEKGEFTDRDVITNVDENAGGKRGIPYYQRTLDLLANQFAKVMNEANQGFLQDPEGNFITKGKNDAGEEIGVPVTIQVNGKDEKVNSDWSKISEDVQNAILNEVGLADKAAMEAAGLTGKNVLDAFMKGQKYDNGEGKFIPENKEDILAEDGTVQEAGWGKNAKGIFVGGVLFSNNPGNDDPSGITAANISVSNTWETTHLLVCDYTCPPGDLEPASGASENIRHFEYLVTNQKFDFIPTTLDGYENASGAPMLNGTFFEMWNNIGTTRGGDQSKMEVNLNANYKNLLSVDTARDSVSSVDFNDEAMNLMMYSKSYNAACRLMTTIDSVLDKLINGTGITT
ncbi:flagellar basal body rod C-terminal domain-containing protein [uncultured Oscillibacter sp.]|uniref:FlgK family flagellar hook-associated protein n=1 Tax=uncultured Oscillibacter sp. TaxID=876091 RepID=UPI00261D63EF|nr:flagellar basal body rod C-terminal domain-containing protein [uncultured Oscillibacter sp.]